MPSSNEGGMEFEDEIQRRLTLGQGISHSQASELWQMNTRLAQWHEDMCNEVVRLRKVLEQITVQPMRLHPIAGYMFDVDIRNLAVAALADPEEAARA